MITGGRWAERESENFSYFLIYDFWTPTPPPPPLSILYMDLICNTWI